MDPGGNRGRGRRRGRGRGRGRGGDQQQQGPAEQERRRPDPRDQGRGRGGESGRNLPAPSAPRGDQQQQGPGEQERRRPDPRDQGRGRGGEPGRNLPAPSAPRGDQQQQGPGEQERRRPDPRDQGRGRGGEPGRNLPAPSAPRGRGGQPSQPFETGTSSQPGYQAPSPRGGYQPAPRGWGVGVYRARALTPPTATSPMPTPTPQTEASPFPVSPVREMAEMTISSDPGPSRSVPAGPSTTAEESSSGALTPVSRPDGGGKVATTTVRLLANHFLAAFNPSQKIFHYDVDITQNGASSKGGSSKKRGRVSKTDAQAIKQKLLAENRDVFGNATPVYDLEKNLYSPVRLTDAKYTVKLSKGDDGKVKEYTVALHCVNILDGRRLEEFLNRTNTNHVRLQQEFIQALDLVLREHPSSNRIIVGRSLYPKQPDRDGFLGGGVIASRGFSQSLRPTAQGIALNVDFSVVAFHQPIPVLDYLWENCKVDCRESQQLSPKERRDAENALKGLKVRVIHRLTSQKYVVGRFTKQITRDLTFELGEEGGPKETVSIVNYFKDRYKRDIRFKLLPCLDVSKTRERTNYVPMEFCEILEGQRYPRDDLSGNQAKSLHRIACPRVMERMNLINRIMSSPDGPIGGPYARQFQITVSTDMTQVMGRVLGAPQLRLGNGGQVREVTPRPDDRQWNLLRSHVFDGKVIDKWGLMNFSWEDPSNRRELVDNFSHMLVARCGDLGIGMNPKPVVCIFEQMRKFSNVGELRQTLMGANARAKGQLQILICIMEERHVGYKILKLICETEIGLITQCCLFDHVIKCWDDERQGSQYLANLALKINAKVGGSNAALLQSLSRQLPRFGQSHVAYFGADVNHPGSRDGRSPSIAAVVASINWPWCNRYVTKIRSQENRKEHIVDLGQMVRELLDEYLKVNHQLPQIILFFRDGVSEGQFNMVLNEELIALKNAFAEFKDYNPTISFIVAQKRHHTRLFPLDGRQATKSGNVPPGTVVDTVIVHPREFDFYLCSHYGLLGTSKPTHYHVLWDENSFMSDELQTLINNLCYTFARCTKPVSLVPPVYYADLAAYRGRLYVEGLALPPSSDTASSSSSSSSAASVPTLHEGVKSCMFFC